MENREEIISSLINELKELKELLIYYKTEEKLKLEKLKQDFTNLVNASNYEKININFKEENKEND